MIRWFQKCAIEHLFASGKILGQRLNIIDLKIDQLTSEYDPNPQDILTSLTCVGLQIKLYLPI